MTANHGAIGADFDLPTAAANFALGDTTFGADGTCWVYVQASGAITQYDAVAIDEDYQAAALTTALAAAKHLIGFAQVAFADNEYGWVATRGSNINVRVSTSVTADTVLWTSSTAGAVTNATAGSKLLGVTVVTALSTAGNVEIIATYPIFSSAGSTD